MVMSTDVVEIEFLGRVVRAGKGFRADRASRTHYSPQPQPWESGASQARGNKVQDQYQRRLSGEERPSTRVCDVGVGSVR